MQPSFFQALLEYTFEEKDARLFLPMMSKIKDRDDDFEDFVHKVFHYFFFQPQFQILKRYLEFAKKNSKNYGEVLRKLEAYFKYENVSLGVLNNDKWSQIVAKMERIIFHQVFLNEIINGPIGEMENFL